MLNFNSNTKSIYQDSFVHTLKKMIQLKTLFSLKPLYRLVSTDRKRRSRHVLWNGSDCFSFLFFLDDSVPISFNYLQQKI